MINSYVVRCLEKSCDVPEMNMTDGDKGGTPLDWVLTHKRFYIGHTKFYLEVEVSNVIGISEEATEVRTTDKDD